MERSVMRACKKAKRPYANLFSAMGSAALADTEVVDSGSGARPASL